MKLIAEFEKFLDDEVNLNKARIKTLTDRVDAIQQFLLGSGGSPKITRFSPQGSWAHKTIIKPPGEQGFDADLLVFTQPVAGWSARDYVLKLKDAFEGSGTYKDKVGLHTRCVRLGEAAHTARIGQGAGNAFLPKEQEGHTFIAARRLHDGQFGTVPAAKGGKRRYSRRIVGEALKGRNRNHGRVEPSFRNIDSTYDLGHGNLPCSCDWSQATVRSCVTTAKIPGSPTVVAGGATGDIATRWGQWPPVPGRHRFHPTMNPLSRYKVRLDQSQFDFLWLDAEHVGS
jgi:hypothetical protein